MRIVTVTDGEVVAPRLDEIEPSLLAESAARVGTGDRAAGAGRLAVDRLAMHDGKIAAFEDDLAGKLAHHVDGAGLVIARGRTTATRTTTPPAGPRPVAAETAGVALAEYLVWTWTWARPRDDRVPWERSWRVSLSAAARAEGPGERRAPQPDPTARARPRRRRRG